MPAPPPPPEDPDEQRRNSDAASAAWDSLARAGEAVEVSLEAADVTVKSAWCFDSLPDLDCSGFDCGGFDCDLGCA